MSSDAKAANAIPEQQILDSAYQLLLAHGPLRLTMADLARRSGVSRTTLYRRWGSVDEVLAALLVRACARVVEEALPDEGRGARSTARLVDGIVGLVRGFRRDPLLRSIIEIDPDYLTPYLVRERSASADYQLATLEAALDHGMAAGVVRRADPQLLARSVLLVIRSFILTGQVFVGAADLDDPEMDRLDAELRRMITAYLAPPALDAWAAA
ncbi:TetR/AcrR family transcriptional regulator [Streptacidiphilus rugosus]|uniref:TetR/AcrR family transcriptional regulator n=1 Tax=Streptacidiphilus rugosus TaxID=405783 RepID=UPI00068E6484|nr:TetR/AcrR family transcriptional regulator [Streptacidiphilus rugosus]